MTDFFHFPIIGILAMPHWYWMVLAGWSLFFYVALVLLVSRCIDEMGG